MAFTPAWFRSRKKQPILSVQIEIDSHYDSKIYTSGSRILGLVRLTALKDIVLDSFLIELLGLSEARVYGPDPTQHAFLRLAMSNELESIPDWPLLKASQTYSVPLDFVLPHQLPHSSCQYAKNTMVHQRHLQLPPTLANWEKHDYSPQEVCVSYSIRATAVPAPDELHLVCSKITSCPILVLPMVPNQSPQYQLSKDSKLHPSHLLTAREQLFSPDIGLLYAEAKRPVSMNISLDVETIPQCSLVVDLRFKPNCEATATPDIQVRRVELHAITHYSAYHIGYLPYQDSRPKQGNSFHRPVITYFAPIKLSHELPKKVLWEPSAEGSIRDFIPDAVPQPQNCSTVQPTEQMNSFLPVYKGSLNVQLALETRNKTNIPTFYSCLVSRTYNIHLTLGVSSFGSSFTLILPLHVSCQSSNDQSAAELPLYTSLDHQPEMLPEYADHAAQLNSPP